MRPRVRPCNRLQKFGSSDSSFSRYFENLSLVRQKEEITRLTECVTVDNQCVVPVRVKSNFTDTCFLSRPQQLYLSDYLEFRGQTNTVLKLSKSTR